MAVPIGGDNGRVQQAGTSLQSCPAWLVILLRNPTKLQIHGGFQQGSLQ